MQKTLRCEGLDQIFPSRASYSGYEIVPEIQWNNEKHQNTAEYIAARWVFFIHFLEQMFGFNVF